MEKYVKTFEQFKFDINESSNDDKTFDLTVKFTNLIEDDYLQLQKMFAYMDWCASVGAGRSIDVYCDGDGCFRANIEMDPKPDKKELNKFFEELDGTGKDLNIGLGC